MVLYIRHGKVVAATGTDWNARRESATRTGSAGSWATRCRDGGSQPMKIALDACAALLLAAATPIHAQDYPKGRSRSSFRSRLGTDRYLRRAIAEELPASSRWRSSR